MQFSSRITALSLGISLLIAAAQPSLAQSNQEAAFDKNKGFVVDKHGHCVRTKWMDGDDPCNPTPPPPPPPVAPPPPPPPPPPVVELEQRTIYFDFDSAELDSEAVYKLNMLVQLINQSKQIAEVTIHGFTDQFGASDYNLKLSERRTQAVEDYLDERSRLDTQAADVRGLGKAAPEAECGALTKRNEKIDCMRKERRVEVEFKYIQ